MEVKIENFFKFCLHLISQPGIKYNQPILIFFQTISFTEHPFVKARKNRDREILLAYGMFFLIDVPCRKHLNMNKYYKYAETVLFFSSNDM